MYKLKSELAQEYNVTPRTFRRYLNTGELYKKLVESAEYKKTQKFVSFKQYHIITEHLGMP